MICIWTSTNMSKWFTFIMRKRNGVSKGRRNLYETDIDCAKREFEEETGLKPFQYNLVSIKSFNESFFGSNNIRYKHVYYLGELLDEHHILLLMSSELQSVFN